MILLCMGGMLPAQSGHPAPFHVGAASASVTPAAPAWLAGYSGAGLSVGVHDSLYAKAVAVSAGDETVVLLTVDCIGMLRTELESKRLMAGEGPKLVLGLGMDAMGYLLKPEFFDKSRKIPHADYLTMVSVGAKGGPEMMDVVRELITSLNR